MRGAVAHDLQRLVREIAREAGDKTKARQMPNGLMHLVEKLGEGGGSAISATIRVVVDRLAQQRHFEYARVGELPHLLDDVLGGAVDFWPASIGDNAIRAEFVAAAGDPDVCLRGAVGRGNAAGEIEQLKVIVRRGETG